MRIERQENSIRLVPESDWERDCLRSLKNRGIEKMEFEDYWNQVGYLQLDFTVHPWDK